MAGKKSLGRRKITIEKIKNKDSLMVTFSKRRKGIFKKASEMCIQTGAEIAIVVESPAHKLFVFGHPAVDPVLNNFLAETAGEAPALLPLASSRSLDLSLQSAEQIRAWEDGTQEEMKEMVEERPDHWWMEGELKHKALKDMNMEELEGFIEATTRLRDTILKHLEDKEKEKRKNSTAAAAPAAIADEEPSVN